MNIKLLLKLEETSIFILSFFLSIILGFDWWLFILFLFVPDISMLGYLFGNKIGADIYNIIHFKLLAITIGIVGYLLSYPIVIFAGLILLGHSALDRIFGFGLKYPDNFKNTHQGVIGNNNNNNNQK